MINDQYKKISNLRHYNITVTRDSNSQEDFMRLRREVYCEEYQILEHEGDEWDTNSVFIIIYYKDEVIAGLRLIYDSEDLGLRVNEYGIKGENHRTVEVSRLIIRKDFRKNFDLLLTLLGVAYIYSRKNGIKKWVATIFRHTKKVIDKIGVHYEIVGPESYWPKGSNNAVYAINIPLWRIPYDLLRRNRYAFIVYILLEAAYTIMKLNHSMI